MIVKIVADIHGNIDDLVKQLEPEDILILLGDHLNLVDFDNFGGIMAEILSKEAVKEVLSELAQGKVTQARQIVKRFFASDGQAAKKMALRIQESYRELEARIPCKSYVLFGNVDVPRYLLQVTNEQFRLVHGEVINIGQQRFGFISGVPPYPWSTGLPGEIKLEDYKDKLNNLTDVDVLCVHFPPAVPSLTFDTVAQRDEKGSQDLLDYIETNQPQCVYFGHVHNPLHKSAQVGKSRLINVGHFRKEKQIFSHLI